MQFELLCGILLLVVSASAELSTRPSTITLRPEFTVCRYADAAEIRCDTTNTDLPDFSWTKENEQGIQQPLIITQNGHLQTHDLGLPKCPIYRARNEIEQGYEVNFLKILRPSQSDEGVYWCKITTDRTTDSAKTVLKTIECPEEIVISLTTPDGTETKRMKATEFLTGSQNVVMKKQAKIGDKITLSCSIHEPGNETALEHTEDVFTVTSLSVMMGERCALRHNGLIYISKIDIKQPRKDELKKSKEE